MGNCGYNCLPNNNDFIISSDSDISSMSTLNTDINSQIHSKLSPKSNLFSGTNISTNNFPFNNISGKTFPSSSAIKRRGPILVKLQKKRTTPHQLF